MATKLHSIRRPIRPFLASLFICLAAIIGPTSQQPKQRQSSLRTSGLSLSLCTDQLEQEYAVKGLGKVG